MDSLSRRDTLPNLLSSVIYQLLTWDDDFSREWRGSVERTVRTDAWRTNSMRAQKELLLKLLNAWAVRANIDGYENNNASAPISIIIDRPDAFCIEPADGGRREWPICDALLVIVELLLEILKEVKGVVKVVVVMHAAFSEVSEQLSWQWKMLEKKWQRPLLVSRRSWQQETR